jgi:hypothetical protein
VGFAMSAIVVVHYTFQLELVVIRWKYRKVDKVTVIYIVCVLIKF